MLHRALAASLFLAVACRREEAPAAPKPVAQKAQDEACATPEKKKLEEEQAKAKDVKAQSEHAGELDALKPALSAALAKVVDKGLAELPAFEAALKDVDAAREKATLGPAQGAKDRLVSLVRDALTCRAVRADDFAACEGLKPDERALGSCRGHVVAIRRVGMAMLQKKDCSEVSARRAVEIYGGDERRFGLFADICKAAVAADPEACAPVAKLAPDQAAFCRALAARDVAKCDVDQNQKQGCRDRVASIGAAAGWQIAGAKTEDVDALSRALIAQPSGSSASCDEDLKHGTERLVGELLKLDLQKPTRD
jgi:hypothetical protein